MTIPVVVSIYASGLTQVRSEHVGIFTAQKNGTVVFQRDLWDDLEDSTVEELNRWLENVNPVYIITLDQDHNIIMDMGTRPEWD